MDEREANIDLLFRNGLKDYEVLPPKDVWENIVPVIRRKQRPYIMLRAAAAAAVLVSLSFLAYRWSMELPEGIAVNTNVLNAEAEFTLPFPDQEARIADAGIKMSSGIPVEVSSHINQINPALSAAEEAAPSVENNNTTETVIISRNKSENESNPTLPLNAINPSKYYGFEDYSSQYIREDKKADKSGRWSIAALASPTYHTSFRSGNNEFADQRMVKDQPVISYAGGVSFSYKINKRVSIQSGLYYSAFGNELAGISSFSGFRDYDFVKGDRNFEVITDNGTIYTNNTDIFLQDALTENRIQTRYTADIFDPQKAQLPFLSGSLRQNFSYLELPFFLKYKIIDKTLGFNIIGGIASNVLINNAVYASSGGEKLNIGKTSGINPIAFSSSLGMGMEYSITGNFSINLEPTFRYYINAFEGLPGIKVHPYSFGIFSGLSYKF
jgi:hypothetical protein